MNFIEAVRHMQKGGRVRKKGRKTGDMWIDCDLIIEEHVYGGGRGKWQARPKDYLAEYVAVP